MKSSSHRWFLQNTLKAARSYLEEYTVGHKSRLGIYWIFFCGLGTDLLEIRETAARYPWSSFARTACRGFADPPGPFKQSGSIKQIDIPMDMQPDMRMCMQLHLRLAWTWDRNARRPGSLAKI